MWGVNGSSCLLDVSDFPLVSGIVHDPMHIFLEGIVPHDLGLMLYNFIYIEKFLTINLLNSAISVFKYS